MPKYTFILILILTSNACRKILNCDERESFTMAKRNYEGNELRINGYYYNSKSYPELFYRNGITINGSLSDLISNISIVESLMLTGEYGSYIYNNEYRWGLFSIRNNIITREFKNQMSSISCKYPFKESGIIINDSTFVMNSIYNYENDEKTETSNDTFRFKEFTPKPDSINKFIN